jgi:hypothetical protein
MKFHDFSEWCTVTNGRLCHKGPFWDNCPAREFVHRRKAFFLRAPQSHQGEGIFEVAVYTGPAGAVIMLGGSKLE